MRVMRKRLPRAMSRTNKETDADTPVWMRRMLVAALAVAHIPHFVCADMRAEFSDMRWAHEVHCVPAAVAGYFVVLVVSCISQLHGARIVPGKIKKGIYRATTATLLEHTIHR
jgi:hypothetical protein